MPKKSKKGGGGKTEEERLLYLQQRAQAEEEMAKKKEEILTLFLKDKLQKEERNTAANLLKLNEGWRSILRQTRAAELRQDIAVLSQTFERHLDGLNSIIKNLERDLQEAERQSAQVRRIHLQHLERLWAQQDKRLALVQRQWDNDLQLLSSTFGAERTQMLDHSRQQRADLEDATFAMELQHREVMDEVHRLYNQNIAWYQKTGTSTKDKQDTQKQEKQEKQENLKSRILEKQATKRECSQLQESLDRINKIDQTTTHQIHKNLKRVKKLQDVATTLREVMSRTATENRPVDDDLIAAKNQVHQKTHVLWDELSLIHAAGKKQLSDLAIQGDNATKKLQAVVAKGERVLRVAEMCRKLESEQLFSEEEPRPERPETEKPAKEVPELQQVMKRINVAVLQREALKKEKDDLSRENQQLKLLLRQHLDAMTLSDRTLDGRHALLTVYQAPTSTGPPQSDRRHTVIEAVHAVKHTV